MGKITMLAMSATMALSAATAVAAPAATKSNASCYDAYGHYGYSWAYCEHDLYGRSSPADLYYGQDRSLGDGQQFGPLADRRQYSRDRGTGTQDRETYRDDGNGDRG